MVFLFIRILWFNRINISCYQQTISGITRQKFVIKIKTVTSSSVQSTKSGKSSLSSLSLMFAVVLGMPGSKIARKLANLTQINFMESSAL